MFKRAICTTAFLVALASTSAAHSTPHAYSIEPAHTVVSFEVTNLGIAKRRGVFNQVAGLILLDPQLGSGSIDIRVNAQSIHTGNAATQAFVRGKSFLDVEEFSQIAYKAERVVFAGEKPVRIEGKLTLLGVTKDVTLTVSDYDCATDCVLDAATTFRRSAFGMDHYLGLVSDDVKLSIHSVTAALEPNDTNSTVRLAANNN